MTIEAMSSGIRELYDEGYKKGAAAERARIREAVEKLANTPPNSSILWGEGYVRAIRKVLSLLKDGEGE